MTEEKVTLLNINIDNILLEDLLSRLNKGVLVTPNVDDIVKCQKNKEFYQYVSNATYTICDSKIVFLASKILGSPLKAVIPGSDFFPAYYNYHARNENIKIFLLGAAPGVAKKAMKVINQKVRRQIIVGEYSPPFGFESDMEECNNILNIINSSTANVVLVGLGNPKQTKWIFEYKEQLPKINLFLPLGATIDFEAGNIKRAPKIFQKLALEWLYRMFMDPKRLIKRYLIDDIPFFYHLLKQKLGFYKNPFEN